MTIITRSVDRIDGMRGAPFFQPVKTDELATEWWCDSCVAETLGVHT